MPTMKEIAIGAGVTAAGVALGAYALHGPGGGSEVRQQQEINYLQGDKVVSVIVPQPKFGKDHLQHDVPTVDGLVRQTYATHRHGQGPATLEGEALLQADKATTDAETGKSVVSTAIQPGEVLHIPVVTPQQAAQSQKVYEGK